MVMEFQTAYANDDVIQHDIWRALNGGNMVFKITQMCSKTSQKVLCCKIPWETVYELTKEFRGVNLKPFCVLLWPDKHVDVYRTSDMKFQLALGSVAFSESVWEELWVYKEGIVSQTESAIEPNKQLTQHGNMHVWLRELSSLSL